jgi:hypothetical protein
VGAKVALLEIDRDDVETGNVPRVCIKCGAEATEVQYREFTCYPWQTSVLAFFNVRYEPALYQLDVPLPFCQRHRYYWVWATTLKFVLPVVLAIPVSLLATMLTALVFGAESVTPFLVALGGVFVAWLVWNEWRDRRVVRAARIDAFSVVLRNVPERVVERWQARVAEAAGRPDQRAGHDPPHGK